MDINVTMNGSINEVIAALEAMDPEILAGGIAFIAGVFAIIMAASMIFGVVRYLLKAIGYSKMYGKAGEAGWKAFIPVYTTYTNYKISWNEKMFFVYAALYALFFVICNSDMVALQLVSAVAGVAMIVVDVKQHIKMAKLYGKGAGTAVALMFFPCITSLILGLGKAEFTAIAE